MDSAAVVEVLALARAFVAAGWVKNAFSADAARRRVMSALDDRAVKFCLLGALTRAAYELGYPRWVQSPHYQPVAVATRLLVEERPDNELCLAGFNDAPGVRKQDVLALFDQAAARVGGK